MTPPTPQPTRPQGSLARWAAGTLLGALVAWVALVGTAPPSTDDLFIVLAYTRRLLDHGDLAWAAGRGNVEGFTSWADLGVKAAAVALAEDPLGWVWRATQVELLLAVGLGVACVVRAGPGWLPALVAGPVLALTPGLVEGASMRLETPLFVAALLANLLACGRERGSRGAEVALGLLALSLPLVRPEGLLLGAVFVALRWRRGARSAAVTFVLGVASMFLLRHQVFGAWLPNTFHAKSGDSRWSEMLDGLDYLVRGTWFLPLVGLATLPFVVHEQRSRDGSACAPEASIAIGIGVLGLVIAVIEGGDSYAGQRLLAPGWAALLVGALLHLRTARGVGLGLAGAGLLCVALDGALRADLHRHPLAKLEAALARPSGAAEFGCEQAVCRALLEALGPDGSLAIQDLQAIAWYAPELERTDMSGLNDVEIARRPAPGAVQWGKDGMGVALERGVDALHVDFLRVRIEAWSSSSVADLFEHREQGPGGARVPTRPLWSSFSGLPLPAGDVRARLLADYRTASLQLAGCGGAWLNVLVHRRAAGRLRAAGFQVGPPG